MLLLVALATAAAQAGGITPDALRDLAAQQAHDRAVRAGELDTAAPQTALPASRREPGAPATTRSVKYDAPVPRTPTGAPGAGDGRSDWPASAEVTAPQGAIVSDAVTIHNVYGIHMGTWMHGVLRRDVSSADPGLVEIRLTRPVIGDRQVLPAGTRFFARQALNDATKRLELFIEKGITPDGHEFVVQGIVYDLQRVSGLPGILTVNKHNLVRHGAEKGLAALVGGAANSLGSSSPFASAGAAATQTMLNDTNPAINYTATTSVIYVSPQRLEIQVDADF
ncbi:MAG: TrbI/VirB10 family protein [Acidobacteriaceae bacterium]